MDERRQPIGQPFGVADLRAALERSGTARMVHAPSAEQLLGGEEGWEELGIVVAAGDGRYRVTQRGLALSKLAAFVADR